MVHAKGNKTTCPGLEKSKSERAGRSSLTDDCEGQDDDAEVNGATYVTPAKWKSKEHSDGRDQSGDSSHHSPGSPETNQSPRHAEEPGRRQTQTPPAIQREAPSSPGSPATRKATEADATGHGIPRGYSLEHWDPDEGPILLPGSVFDARIWTPIPWGGGYTTGPCTRVGPRRPLDNDMPREMGMCC